jgi:hypothetical protein
MDSAAIARLPPLTSVSASVSAAPAGPRPGPPRAPSSDAGIGIGMGHAGGDSPVIKRRAPIACRRCRRMRSKCLHDKGMPPCKACQEFGLGPEDCIFPVRGQPDNDREYRHPRRRADKPPRRDSIKIRRTILDLPSSSISASLSEAWDDLPPLGNLIDGVNRFTRHYFQLGFIPKQRFPERLRKNYLSVNPFLLLSILSISARLTPTLSARYGSGIKAAEYFMERASNLAIGEIYQEPSLERCQAFYLLSIAQQGSGIRNKSFVSPRQLPQRWKLTSNVD